MAAVIELQVIGTDAEVDVIAAGLAGILDRVEVAPRRYPHDDGRRVRAYLRAAAVLPEFTRPPEPAPVPAAPADGPYPVPDFPGNPPPPRQRWNPALGRHCWWHPAEHWYRCLHCGVLRHNKLGGGRWFFAWGYPGRPAGEWGTTRGGAAFPPCPGPGVQVPAPGDVAALAG